jgi:tetratricopeptide (TPR) repeat protein
MRIGVVPLVLALVGALVAAGCRPGVAEKPTDVGGVGLAAADPGPALTTADAHADRAYQWLVRGDPRRALADYDAAVRLAPDNPAFLNSRGFAWHMSGIDAPDREACEDRALADYGAALRLDPAFASAVNNRAWILATSRVDRCRDGARAVEEARRACELAGWRNSGYIDTLSVAYAETGDFEEAARWQRRAIEDPGYERESGAEAREKLELFTRRKPYRE